MTSDGDTMSSDSVWELFSTHYKPKSTGDDKVVSLSSIDNVNLDFIPKADQLAFIERHQECLAIAGMRLYFFELTVHKDQSPYVVKQLVASISCIIDTSNRRQESFTITSTNSCVRDDLRTIECAVRVFQGQKKMKRRITCSQWLTVHEFEEKFEEWNIISCRDMFYISTAEKVKLYSTYNSGCLGLSTNAEFNVMSILPGVETSSSKTEDDRDGNILNSLSSKDAGSISEDCVGVDNDAAWEVDNGVGKLEGSKRCFSSPGKKKIFNHTNLIADNLTIMKPTPTANLMKSYQYISRFLNRSHCNDPEIYVISHDHHIDLNRSILHELRGNTKTHVSCNTVFLNPTRTRKRKLTKPPVSDDDNCDDDDDDDHNDDDGVAATHSSSKQPKQQ